MIKKKIIFILATTIFLASSLSTFATEVEKTEDIFFEEEISQEKQMILQLDSTLAWIDGLEYTLTALPKVIDGRTYLPLRFMADMLLEAEVDWDPLSRKVMINKDGTQVEVKIDHKQAYINGDQVEIGNPPIIANSLTYLPLRAIGELFDIQTNYDEETRRITLIKVQEGSFEPEIIKPGIPQFSFEQQDYVAGQAVKTIDESFHEKGLKITNRLWMIDFDESKTNTRLENMFAKPVAGNYLVSLKVEVGKGNWSEWTTKEITIKPNQKPVITSLVSTQASYAAGEPMDFAYTYDNESWEDIKATRWTYRRVGEVVSKAVVKKPQYIFQQGEYMVTLQLQDEYNNWSDTKELIVNINSEVRQSELAYRFTSGKPGDIIDNFNNFNYVNYRSVVPSDTFLTGGSLFVSNSPEKVTANGILYKDAVQGSGRILLHHYNGFTEEENIADPKKVVLVAENTTDQPAIFTLSNRADKGPSSDILFVGQQLLYDYFKGSEPKTYSLNPGEKVYIYDSGSKKWDKGQLVSVQMDFNVVGSVTFTTATLSKTSSIDDINDLPVLEKDAHPRGTFEATDIYHKVVIDSSEPTKIVLGGGDEDWVNGYDAITNIRVQNRGNFAVHYRIQITAEEDTGIMLNPRADVFRGALKWDGEEAFLAPRKGYFMGHNSKGVMLGVVKKGETRTLEYSLPNGSASPVLLVFMPEHHWNQ